MGGGRDDVGVGDGSSVLKVETVAAGLGGLLRVGRRWVKCGGIVVAGVYNLCWTCQGMWAMTVAAESKG